jgi:membrane-bound serine protease (ClpP class)
MKKLFDFFTYLFIFSFFSLGAIDPVMINLKGYLGHDQLENAQEKFDQFIQEQGAQVVLIIDSSSGDLTEVFNFAKKIYESKINHTFQLIVYIQTHALGPSAIFPFLADQLYTSFFVSWGDIPLNSENNLPANILRNQVRSLINPTVPHVFLLDVLASGMTDPSLTIVEDKGWKISDSSNSSSLPIISPSGQTLVVNQNQLKMLGLVRSMLSLDQLKELFHINETNLSPVVASSLSYLSLTPEALEQKLQAAIPFKTDEVNTIGYLYIGDHEDSINQSTWLYIKQGLDYYQKTKPLFIILELDTPGGEVFAAQKISDALKEMDVQFGIPIVAYINNWAISAGAMLAYSSRFIATAKDGSMGAAEPVLMGDGGKMESASEKVNSALRADFANRARFFDRNPLLAEAMVDKDLILVLRHGKIIQLDNENQMRLTGPEADLVISPKGKLLTLDTEKMVAYGVADCVVPDKKQGIITAEEQQAGKWPADKMPLFQLPFFSTIPNATIHKYQMDWKTRFFVLMATPLVSSLLMMGLLIGGYMEFNSPGLGWPGLIAATCLFFIILSSFALQIASWLEVIILLVGLILILAEVFILPTFGLLGILGIVLFIVGLFSLLLPGISSISFDPQSWNAAGDYFINRLAWLSGSFILSTVIIAWLARYVLPRFSVFNRFVLVGSEQEASQGYFAGNAPQDLPAIGSQGEVLATLRPAGKIIIKNKIYDAISTGHFIEAGTAISVVRLDGGTPVVDDKKEKIT